VTRLRVALCQLDPTVGDLEGNTAAIVDAIEEAEDAGCDLAVFGELAVTGYPPEDLLLKPGFVADNLAAMAKVAAATGRCTAVVGFVDDDVDLYNAAAVCAGGDIVGVYHKQQLPNYAVFDEKRYFAEGRTPLQLWSVGGVRIGVSICEDVFSPDGPVQAAGRAGAELVVNINGSPFYAGRSLERRQMLATRAADASVHLVYVNQVGGQDELVFDGGSMVFDSAGRLVTALPQFESKVAVVDLDVRPVFRQRLLDPRGRHATVPAPCAVVTERPRQEPDAPRLRAPVAGVLDPEAEIYAALVLGTRDYVHKNGFTDVVVSLSGGVDSSLVAAVATDALGPGHVHGVAMPSRYSSDHSVTDAEELCRRLGIDLRVVTIEPAHAAYLAMLAPARRERPPGEPDLTDENLQSRIRGVLLMAFTNEMGWLALTAGNKSEAAVGYSTLYGDTAGGFAVIKDVAKTMVYRLCAWRNARDEVIPPSVLSKPPSAELRPDQRDDQSLPPYSVLDPILEGYVEADMTAGELVAAGFDEELVRRLVRMVDTNEYKRRQSPPGVRVTPKAFGRDRRVPITNRYR
jgi:NAD+ synthase (glutamine-hydrolysing)